MQEPACSWSCSEGSGVYWNWTAGVGWWWWGGIVSVPHGDLFSDRTTQGTTDLVWNSVWSLVEGLSLVVAADGAVVADPELSCVQGTSQARSAAN